jgi:hypothetical protein
MKDTKTIDKILEAIILNQWPLNIDWSEIIYFPTFLEIYNHSKENFAQTFLQPSTIA